MRLPVKSPELVCVFIEASRNLKSIFLAIKMPKIKNNGSYTESTDLIFNDLQIIHLV